MKYDWLWVREAFRRLIKSYGDGFWYKADNHRHLQDISWKPSIHMPMNGARIWLEVKDVTCERVQNITESSLVAEGVKIPCTDDLKVLLRSSKDYNARDFFPKDKPAGYELSQYDLLFAHWGELWCDINGIESWDSNPWVWAITFQPISTTGKPLFKNINAAIDA